MGLHSTRNRPEKLDRKQYRNMISHGLLTM